MPQTATVTQFPTRFARQAAQAQEARILGIRIHSSEVALGRAEDRQWGQLTPEQKAGYDEKGALALRLGDPIVVSVATEEAARAIRTMHPELIPSLEAARFVAAAALVAFTRSLAGAR